MADEGWDRLPPVVILSGSQEFLRLRELRKAIRASEITGRRVDFVEGSDKQTIIQLISSVGVLFSDSILLVINDPNQINHKMVLDHHESGSTDVCLLLHYEDDIGKTGTLAKIAAALPKKRVISFASPADHKAKEVAVRFCQQEMKRWGKMISETLLTSMVNLIGTDLGQLAFEIKKVVYLVGDREEITAADVGSTMAVIGEASANPVTEALGNLDPRGLLKALAAVKKNAPSDPTIKICAFVGSNATKWLHALSLDAQRVDVPEGARRVGVPPYVYEKLILPPARRWGVPHVIQLVHQVGRVERAVRSGHVDPWIELECALLTCCRKAAGLDG